MKYENKLVKFLNSNSEMFTANEIATKIGVDVKRVRDHLCYLNRDFNKIFERKKRECSITKNEVYAWKLKDNIAIPDDEPNTVPVQVQAPQVVANVSVPMSASTADIKYVKKSELKSGLIKLLKDTNYTESQRMEILATILESHGFFETASSETKKQV